MSTISNSGSNMGTLWTWKLNPFEIYKFDSHQPINKQKIMSSIHCSKNLCVIIILLEICSTSDWLTELSPQLRVDSIPWPLSVWVESRSPRWPNTDVDHLLQVNILTLEPLSSNQINPRHCEKPLQGLLHGNILPLRSQWATPHPLRLSLGEIPSYKDPLVDPRFLSGRCGS